MHASTDTESETTEHHFFGNRLLGGNDAQGRLQPPGASKLKVGLIVAIA